MKLIQTIATEVDKELQVEPNDQVEEDKFAHLLIKRDGETTGHVIAKGVGKNLNLLYQREKLEEIDQYDNLLVTNYIEWYWINNNQLMHSDHICTNKELKNKPGLIPELAKILSVHQLISEFCSK
ncbi:MAG: hypothetical protein K9I94_00145 [Bacteroidales bacterium]|nr:hypothetical protein [Bacteroidales bacterium]